MDCINYEEEYRIHSDGRVYGKKYNRFKRPTLDNGGYYQVRLSKNGIVTTHYIHKLVATHYIPNPDNLPITDHIDFNTTNNDITNLRWVSYRESSLHRRCASATPNIHITPSGTYQVQIEANGLRFDKSFKTLNEAEQARNTFILENGL